MAAENSTRDRILDAFQKLLITQGERAATLEACAAQAGVSKGGLLYHFGSRDALILGLIDRADALSATYLAEMQAAPGGVVDSLIRTSLFSDDMFDHATIALNRLAQEDHRAIACLLRFRHDTIALLEAELGDPVLAETVMLISDGMYYDSVLRTPEDSAAPTPNSVPAEAILAVVHRLIPSD
ncbi:TetR/AcrR family transcriptional regulator [Mycetocola tolaasinivorans]|uniref:TetR/AcrR family transcriptional regulator n=1 Tax=Mycetocola tolaasinivorans TaxID=76635 RepID=A0A3L7A9K2_9MICO|nr:TetR/AcrR family transcriptional regulator [Mycetocola tolaasinivorans]RLP76538.1 TetR/AcrR family transcriptional regulator [Mycetocola tolaasinivorans]